MPLVIPLEIILAVGIAVDLVLAYLGFNVFKIIRNKIRARKRSVAQKGVN